MIVPDTISIDVNLASRKFNELISEEIYVFYVVSFICILELHCRRVGRNNVYEATTWRILFSLNNVNQTGTYTLRIALAASSYADILVRKTYISQL